MGILAIVDYIASFCQLHNITEGMITIVCDGKSVIDILQYKSVDTISPNSKHSDVTSAVIKTISMLPIDLKFQHVKGHQDDELEFCDLSRLSQLNVLMDIDAKYVLEDVMAKNITQYQLDFHPHPNAMIGTYVNGILIPDELATNIYNRIMDERLLTYWVTKGRFNAEDIQNIDWDNQEKAMKLVTLTKRRFISKWSSDWNVCGKNIKRWQIRPHGYCPYCQSENEDNKHILQCIHHDALQNSHDALWQLVQSLVKIGTCVSAVRAIRDEIVAWRNNDQYPSLVHLPDELKEVIQAQRNIGWKSFLEGLYSKKWKAYQETHFNKIGSKRSPNLWTSKAIRIGWTYLSTIWQYRNEQLHKTERIKDMKGKKEMIKAIKAEYKLGLGRLPAYGFSYMSKKKIDDMMKYDMDSMIQWLSIIKQGRIVYDDPNRIKNEFFEKGALYNMLDLKELTDEDLAIDM